jgi:hypothetical protein
MARTARALAHFEVLSALARVALHCDQCWQGLEFASAGIVFSRELAQSGCDDCKALGGQVAEQRADFAFLKRVDSGRPGQCGGESPTDFSVRR